MGKKGKIGKSRKDKFYHLAKETGYRSRSAFKLIQLNRKFQFLQKARALVDLCAAPGGWLQVASKFMPVSSLIIGVDLVPIKPIPNVVTFQEDITSDSCRQAIKKQLQTWKADVVLNDGAPNVGANWTHDAFSQVHLSLMALRLACDCLAKGGWFITKVFRSSDYQSLLWILQQFFKKVSSTKPQASRSESAEIFVVCQGYFAPDKIDSRFFDPKFAFKDVEGPVQTVSQLVSQKKPKAEGYAEGSLTLYNRVSLIDFLRTPNPVDFLSKTSEIALDHPELEKHTATTDDIRECCRDIKVLGRKELRSLLSWRTKLRRYLAKQFKESKESGKEINLSSGEEEDGEEEEKSPAVALEDENEELDRKLAEVKAEELATLKRKKKRLLKTLQRQRERVELKMDLPGVSIADEGETGMFSLRSIGKSELLQSLSHGDMSMADSLVSNGMICDGDVVLSDDEGSVGDDEISLASDIEDEDLQEVRAREENARKTCIKEAPSIEQSQEDEKEETNPLLVSLEEKSERQQRDTNLWFGKGVFSSMDFDADEDLEIKQTQLLREKNGEKPLKKVKDKKNKKAFKGTEGTAAESPEENLETQSSGEKMAPVTDNADGDLSESDSDSSEDEKDIKSMKRKHKRKRDQGEDETADFEVVPVERPVKRTRVLNPEGLAIGTVIATSKKSTRDLIDKSFNRYAFNEDEDELPDWFVTEEKKHRIIQVPVDRQTMEEYRKRQQELNARPIKKVAEAKARKKRRMLKKMEQAKKKAEAVVNTVDISEREKAAQLRSVYKKAGLGKEKRQVTYVVSKKGVGRKVRRPAGVKGQFKVVDARMKKDMRSQRGRK
ncbi:pre-rRNA 2'-O-ribose RNA methyltransferase FTSJ3 [Spea bombifrons]|uniref:pre-rRNA 2'-O-ribose RNA methyltransferase FTSJ3 n=1 Tax=Spea bombifrons TaxID=233779 RepID=UPI00234BA4C8|nr:pre-rRNA 2'-O-ribose RNA methyltransferase FTSJ3 [Spea bombifrons]